jgi:hypothetical protein
MVEKITVYFGGYSLGVCDFQEIKNPELRKVLSRQPRLEPILFVPKDKNGKGILYDEKNFEAILKQSRKGYYIEIQKIGPQEDKIFAWRLPHQSNLKPYLIEFLCILFLGVKLYAKSKSLAKELKKLFDETKSTKTALLLCEPLSSFPNFYDPSRDKQEEVLIKITDENLLKLFDQEISIYKKPQKPVIQKPSTELVKVGLHSELQKFEYGLRPISEKDTKEYGVEVIGLDLALPQDRAMFALQKLFNDTNYEGNIPGREMNSEIDNNKFKFKGYLPALKFTPSQYLEAFGVKKYETERGFKEYGGAERKWALDALLELAMKHFLFVYKRKYCLENNKGKKIQRTDRIEVIAPLIKIMRGWEALTKKEDILLSKGISTQATDKKLKAIAIEIEPAPIMVQDINSYFLLKPANFFQEIKLKYPGTSKSTYLFIDWLIAQAELKRRKRKSLIIEENFETIAAHLRMNSYLKNKKITMIRQIMNNCYKRTKEFGYLLSHETIQGQTKELDRLVLNPEKFRQVRKIDRERKRLESRRKN